MQLRDRTCKVAGKHPGHDRTTARDGTLNRRLLVATGRVQHEISDLLLQTQRAGMPDTQSEAALQAPFIALHIPLQAPVKKLTTA